MKAIYIRVSTTEQNTNRQENTIEGAKVFIDKISGSIPFSERPEGSKLMNLIKEGNVSELHVHSIDRLGRNTIDILTTIKLITSYNCNVISEKEGLKMLDADGKPNPIANLMIGILSTLAEFELSRIKERQAEGIKEAKKRNQYVGRAIGTAETTEVFLNKAKTKEIQKYIKAGESIRRAAKLSGASISLVQKVIKLTSK
ncbi:MAG: recombinase family protein [Flavobacterium sp.]|nr:recombinase family protein [Flavobacterium sp.]